MKRRSFIHQSALAAGVISPLPLITSTFQKKPYRIALIGSGWWGMNILREAIAHGDMEVAGLCDVDEHQLKAASDEVITLSGQRPKWYKDYREILQVEKPDIAIIATPDHWHALGAIEAMKNGAHIYLEKPIGHTVLEGKAILDTARRMERIVQVGTHRRVSPHNLSAMEFLRSGKLGDISAVKCFVNYNQGPGEMTPDERPPKGLDWDMWCGPAPLQPFNTRIHPRGFRQFLDYANGQIGDWGIHWFDQVLWWTEEKHPKSVYSTGGRFVKKDNTDAPDTQYATFAFESFTLTWEHKLCAANANEEGNVGCYFYGTEGTLHLGWLDGWTFYPSRKGQSKIHVEAVLNEPDQQNIRELWRDFIAAIEKDKRPVCDIEHGYLATNLSLLGMISYKLGRSIAWNGPSCSIPGDEEATEMLRRPYRSPWIYPE